VKIIVVMMIILMNVDCYSLLRAKVRFARLMMSCITKLLHMHISLQGLYTLDVVKLTNDIYTEMRDVIKGDLQMVIDARKIISNLDIPLENEEWETLRNVKWGPLINETYDDIIYSVGELTDSATRELKNGTTEDVGGTQT